MIVGVSQTATTRGRPRGFITLLRSELTRTAHKLSHMPASQGPRRSPVEPPCGNGEMLDLVIIGAGPHALSLLGRLVEEVPDLLTERERVRIAHKAGSRGKSHGSVRKHLQKKSIDGRGRLPNVAVIDAHGEWLAQWKADFSALDIRHTRSHSDLHPCPFDFASLRVWAELKGRQRELLEMDHIDRDHSRSLGYGGPFTLVGTALFNDFCASLVERYGLAPLVRKGNVQDIHLVPCEASSSPSSPLGDGGTENLAAEVAPPQESEPPPSPCTFELKLDDGSTVAARRVVCAMGPGPAFLGMRATLPWWAEDLAASLAAATTPVPSAGGGGAESGSGDGGGGGASTGTGGDGDEVVPIVDSVTAEAAVPLSFSSTVRPSERLIHSSQLPAWLRGQPSATRGPPLSGLLRGSRVLVVGGGQTAAHLALLALRAGGAAAVTIAARRRIVIKPYDVELEAVGDRRAEVLGRFWRMDSHERLKYIGELRGGGSMSHEVRSELRRYEQAAEGGERPVPAGPELEASPEDEGETPGRLEVLEEVEVSEARWHAAASSPAGASAGEDAPGDPRLDDNSVGGEILVELEDGRTRSYDFVWLATGGNLDLSLVPIFSSLMAQRPISTCGALPRLQPDLAWDVNCPLHVMGAFAMLQLGPDALNLAGARSGGVTVARALLEAWRLDPPVAPADR